MSGNQDIPAEADVVITSYSLASRVPQSQKLSSQYWDFLICDEAHALKSPTSQQTKVILKDVWPKALYRLAITGTPVPNGRAAEAFPLFSRMLSRTFGDWKKFCARYCIPKETPYGMTYPWSRHLDELGGIASDCFMVRRSREEILSELPELTRSIVPLDLASEWVTKAESGIDYDDVIDCIEMGAPIQPTHIATARKDVGLIKALPAVEYIKQILTEEDHVVVFCHHTDVFTIIKVALHKAGVSTVEIHGSTPPEARQAAVDDFQNGEAQVFLGSITAASTGITLTKASTVIFVEADWVPSTNEQAEGRIRRIGQKEIMRAIYLVAPDSLDEAILSTVLRKQNDINTLMTKR
jgi:SWI/SNF-related matrix-associated actin-dependent regulator 1 of chromatin subfamily A